MCTVLPWNAADKKRQIEEEYRHEIKAYDEQLSVRVAMLINEHKCKCFVAKQYHDIKLRALNGEEIEIWGFG